MSIQAGVWNLDGEPVKKELITWISKSVAEYGQDGDEAYFEGPVGMLYCPFYTTLQSRLEHQPHVTGSGKVFMWDGRLDNRDELIAQLHNDLRTDHTDVAIVAAAFERWGKESFARFVGDWALTIWDPSENGLFLGIDYIGVKHLYYLLTRKQVMWCSHLEPIIKRSGGSLRLNDDYVAGYLASSPDADQTPYREIDTVPPGKFVLIQPRQRFLRSYYHIKPSRKIRYKSDKEYEEHFRFAFRTAVKRRLRSDSPVLAELSGGLDSSSIVCMADDVIRSGEVDVLRLDTLSFYSVGERDGDERPFFCKVEERLGRSGCHIDVERHRSSDYFGLRRNGVSATPGLLGIQFELSQSIAELAKLQGNRVLLSGIGGDELLGGIPDPYPQLADLVMQFRLIALCKQLFAWSLAKRIPLLHIMSRTFAQFLPALLRARLAKQAKIEAWIEQPFAHRTRIRFRQTGELSGLRLALPSDRENIRTVMGLRRRMASWQPSRIVRLERRYPFLDQSLVEFLISIPPDQLLRPGQRRWLMRRALANLVPLEILNRASKALTARSHIIGIQTQWDELERLLKSSLAERMGYINSTRLLQTLDAARAGSTRYVVRLVKGILLEVWLRNLASSNVVKFPAEEIASVSRTLVDAQA